MEKRKKTNGIVLHHSDYKYGTSIKEIRSWHKQRGFSDVGYHFLIKKDGTIEEGRDLNLKGAHSIEHNADTVGICLDGDFSVQIPLPKQLEALNSLLDLLFDFYGWDVYEEFWERVYFHRDLDKENPCPGRNFQSLLMSTIDY